MDYKKRKKLLSRGMYNPFDELRSENFYVPSINKQDRTLSSEDFLIDLNNSLIARACNLDRINEVLKAFLREYPEKTGKLNHELHIQAVYFPYDGYIWKGSCWREQSMWRGELLTFYNIKLPNDGYIYSNLDGEIDIRNTNNSSSTLLIETLRKIMPDTYNMMGKEDGWFYNFKFKKLEIRYRHGNIVYHIGFEYGSPESKE